MKKKAAAKKVEKVMREFKAGKLHSGKDPKGPKKAESSRTASRLLRLPLLNLVNPKEEIMSSGQFRRREKFNSVIIRDRMVVRLNKNGTIRAVLGKYGEYGKKDKA